MSKEDLDKQYKHHNNKEIRFLNEKLKLIAMNMEKSKLNDYVRIMGSPRKIIVNNLVAGVARGFGIAVGFTIFTGTILYLLQQLGALNLPVVGGYIADIVRIVQAQLHGRAY